MSLSDSLIGDEFLIDLCNVDRAVDGITSESDSVKASWVDFLDEEIDGSATSLSESSKVARLVIREDLDLSVVFSVGSI